MTKDSIIKAAAVYGYRLSYNGKLSRFYTTHSLVPDNNTLVNLAKLGLVIQFDWSKDTECVWFTSLKPIQR